MEWAFLSSANLPLAVEDEIISYANSCIKAHLCQRLGTIKEKELQNINRHDELGPSVFIPRVIRPDNSPEQDCPNNVNATSTIDIISLTIFSIIHASSVVI